LLAEQRTDRCRDKPRQDVGRPARGERHDEGDRPARIAVFGARAARGENGGGRNQQAKNCRDKPVTPAKSNHFPPLGKGRDFRET